MKIRTGLLTMKDTKGHEEVTSSDSSVAKDAADPLKAFMLFMVEGCQEETEARSASLRIKSFDSAYA